MKLSPIARRRWHNFRANRRAYYSLWIMSVLLVVTLFAEFIANDKPLLVSYRGEWYSPVLQFRSERDFGGEFATEAEYKSMEVKCLIRSGGLDACLDDPNGIYDAAASGIVDGEAIEKGWVLWPPIPYHFTTVNYDVQTSPSDPDANHWLGTDDETRDIGARIIYGFRISMMFALVVTIITSIFGIAAGAIQGFFGGWVDLIFQRFIEIWSSMPTLYVLIILGAIFNMNFILLTLIIMAFGWTGLVGVVRAEFFRARNFEYVRAAQALGLSDARVMFRHILPNALVATVTLLPFLIVGAIATLTSLDFLGFGLPSSYPSLGELAQQAKRHILSPHLGIAAFATMTIMLSLLVFIFEGVRDAFDPRKIYV